MSTKFDSLNRQKTENDWLLFAASFMVKFELVFVLTQKYFFWETYFKANQKSTGSSIKLY